MVAQILAYLVIIGITTILAIQMIHFAKDYIKSDKIICNVLGIEYENTKHFD